MATADERRREYQREYQKAWRARNPEKTAEIRRRNAEKNLERNRELRRAWRQANPGAEREQQRAYRAAHRLRQHAQLSEEERTAMWAAQNGRCYLCGEPMTQANARIDHDYSCCPRNASCPVCRRGLAHHRCNILIGMADESPRRLRRMADALETAQQSVRSSAPWTRYEPA